MKTQNTTATADNSVKATKATKTTTKATKATKATTKDISKATPKAKPESTPEPDTALTMSEETKLSLQTQYVNEFNLAYGKMNASAWDVAKVAFDTVNASDFKEVFGKQKTYAEKLNFSNSGLTNMIKSYTAREYVRTKGKLCKSFDVENIDKMTIGQWQEISAIETDELIPFLENEQIKSNASVRTIRECVKAWKETGDTKDEPEVVAETEVNEVSENEPEVEENDKDIMTISYNGRTLKITDAEYEFIAQILSICDAVELARKEKESDK